MRFDAEKIAALAEDVAQDEGLELVDVEILTEGPRAAVRVFVDREGGVRLRDCESVSRRLGAVLDVEDPVSGPYTLEVSSPGLERRLKKPKDFAACRGRRVKVHLSASVDGSRNFRGILLASDEEGIELERNGTKHRLPYRLMRKANREITQEELFGKGTKKR